MGNDKTPLTSPQVFSYNGIFEPDVLHASLKDFLEVDRNYDITENEVNEVRKDDFLSISTEFDGIIHLTDYIEFQIYVQLDVEGNDKVVTDNNGAEHRYIEGSAKMKIFSFITQNDNNMNHSAPIVEFFRRVYNAYFNNSEMKLLKDRSEKDVKDTITRFKQLTNMSTQRL